MTCTKKSFLKQGSLNYPFGEDQTSSKCIVMFFGISLLNSALFGLVTYGFPRQEPVLALYDEESGMQVDQNWDETGGCGFLDEKNPKKNITSPESHPKPVVFWICCQKFQVKTSYENFQNARRKYPKKPFLGHRPVSILGFRSVLFDLEGVAMELKTKIEED